MATQPQAKALDARLKVRHLELFRHVCTLGSLRKAADASAMTQPAATKLIQDFEAMLGKPLFVRDRRGMTPTLYGQVVLHHANILLADVRTMREAVDLLGQGVAGTIRLGVIPSLSPVLLTGVIAHVLANWPGIRFVLREGSTSQLLRELAANELDLAFARLLDSGALQDLEVLDVYAESFAVVCAPGHPLAAKPRVSWKDLGGARWMLPAAGTPLRELVNGLFMREKALVPIAAVEHGSFEKSQYLIAETDLVGLLPVSMANVARQRGQVRIIGPRLSDFGPVSLVRRGGIETPPVVSLFTEVVREKGRAVLRARAKGT